MAVAQQGNLYQSTRLLLDGQQRRTSLSAVIRGEPVNVRGRRKPIEFLFNLEHPDVLSVVTEVDETLHRAWKECVDGIHVALNFVRSNVAVDSRALLSSPYILVTIAYYGHQKAYHVSADEAAGLRRWVLVANAKGRYSRGSSETVLDQDLALIPNGGGSAGRTIADFPDAIEKSPNDRSKL